MNSPSSPPTYRLLLGLVIGLVVLNGALLCWLWLAPGPSWGHPPRPDFRPRPPDTFLADTLGFSPAQRARYDTLRAQYFRQMQPLMARAHATRLDYFGLLDSTLTDEQLTRRAAASHDAMTALDVLTLRHFQQVAALCTPAQRRRLSQVLARLPMLRRGAPGPFFKGRMPDRAAGEHPPVEEFGGPPHGFHHRQRAPGADE